MRVALILVIVFVSQCSGEQTPLSCPGNKDVDRGLVCIENRNCSHEASHFKWVPGQAADEVVAEFNSSLCRGSYAFSLRTLDDSERTNCNGVELGTATLSKFKMDRVWLRKHSERFVRVIGEDEAEAFNYKPCGEELRIKFNMVYSSCYKLIRKREGPKKDRVGSEPVFIATSMTKQDVLHGYEDPLLASRYMPESDKFLHSVQNLDQAKADILKLSVRLCYKDQNCEMCELSEYQWTMMLNEAGKYECGAGEKNAALCYAVGRNEIKCFTGNVANRSQCLYVELKTHPCTEANEIWENLRCSGRYRFATITENVVRENKDAVEIEGDYGNTVVMVGVVLALLVVCTVVLYLVLKFIIIPPPFVTDEVKEKPLNDCQVPEILLLYSRDCKEFMQVMTSFRTLLSKALNCKVHDCFDPTAAERVACGSVEWLTGLLEGRRRDVKVVVVETACSLLRHGALCDAARLQYRAPGWLDDLFLHALQVLSNDRRNNQYNRVFVVLIDGFTDETGKLGNLTSRTRYLIPQYLNALFYDLYRRPDVDYTAEHNALLRDIAALRQHKEENGDYLNSLLVQRVCEERPDSHNINMFA